MSAARVMLTDVLKRLCQRCGSREVVTQQGAGSYCGGCGTPR